MRLFSKFSPHMFDYETVPFLSLVKCTKVDSNLIILSNAMMSTYDDKHTYSIDKTYFMVSEGHET